ncbi:MAG: hypothetical protein IJL98_02860 [Lachnospiraceae bacterium]|nr:hypothetical protein [Lachnospiraceae bacterium]
MKLLLRSEIYRLFRQKSTFIVLTAAAVFMTVSSLSWGMILGNAPWVTRFFANILESGYLDAYGPQIAEQIREIAMMHADTVCQFIAANFRGDLVFFLGFFIACFYRSEAETGYRKNLAFRYTRQQFYIVHVIIVFAYAVVLTLIPAGAITLVSFGFFRSIPFGNAGRLILYLLVLTALYTVIGMFLMILIDLFRNKRMAVVLFFVYLLILSGLLYTMIEAMFSGGFSIRLFTPVGNLSVIDFGTPGTYLPAAVCSLFYAGLAFMIEFYSMRERNI